MIRNYKQEIIDLATAEGLHFHHAASLVYNAADPDELKAYFIDREAHAAAREARSRAFRDAIEATTYEQQVLFNKGLNVPKAVRVEMDGEEIYKSSQDATITEHADHYQWAINKQRTLLGRLERVAQPWRELADDPSIPADVPFGQLFYENVNCSICHTGWRPNDDMEWAHDTALGNGTQDQRMRLAHRSCNRAEGQGFVNIA
jgi:hypothetical protein